jgi:4-diphosphocytidyl-2-C-methyl-D-erythritol kinase
MEHTAHAKLNLALGITGVREDGYHLLDTLFCRISLCDTLRATPSARAGVTLGCSDASLLGEGNLVLRAAHLFQQQTRAPLALHFDLEKRIPIRAGLGGGSADAAAALSLLSTLYPGADDEALLMMARRLGADVPFALSPNGLARARGIGDDLAPLRCPAPLHFVVVKPRKGLDTPVVYRAFDALPPAAMIDVGAAAQALRRGDLPAFAACAGNALEPAARALCPAIDPLLRALYENGALHAAVTGTGSAAFGLFAQERAARLAAQNLKALAPFAAYAHGVGTG